MQKIENADFRTLSRLFDTAGQGENLSSFADLRRFSESMRTDQRGLCYLGVWENHADTLLILSSTEGEKAIPQGFSGTIRGEGTSCILIAPVNTDNIKALLKVFPDLSPVSIGANKTSFGVGDRLGLASMGHIRLFQNRSMVPVLAQQSLRELKLMNRSYRDVVDAALWAVFCSGFDGPWIADGDHLKQVEDAVSALEQGCTMITADLSDHLAFEFMDASARKVNSSYGNLDAAWRKTIEQRYPGEIILKNGRVLHYTRNTLKRLALSFGRAIDHAARIFAECIKVKESIDFEISIDETDMPTTPEAHYFVAQELVARQVRFTAIAPRFVGEFQKGIDYIGNLDDFTASFETHATIAEQLNYKISIHSSSDKFSVYPIIGALVKGAFHLKTAGTNWLVALDTIAGADPIFFREIFSRAYTVFPEARTYYHITPDSNIASDISKLTDTDLKDVFLNPTDRQVLHVCYGELFKNKVIKKQFFITLRKNIVMYWDALEAHIGKHLKALGIEY